MIIIGVGYHPSDQYIAFADSETGECGERRLNHGDGEAEKFYRALQQRAVSVRVGMEATGYSRWFERLLAELDMELWIGDAAKIKTKRVRKQKTDRNDAQLLLWHRHRLVQMRTRIMNQLQALAMNEGNRPQEKAVERPGASPAGKTSVGQVGQPAPARFAGVAGPHDSSHRRANGGGRAGSQEAA
jgi:transposase